MTRPSPSTHLFPHGVHHVALSTFDMAGSLQFFNEVLGLELVMLYWMHGAENVVHGFLRINDYALLGLVSHPDVPQEIDIGQTHPGSPDAVSARGTMQYLCLEVETQADLIALRSRIRSKGIHCFGPQPGERVPSIVFAGPDGMVLKIVVPSEPASEPMNLEAAAAAGLTAQDIADLSSPVAFERPAAPLPNPPLGDSPDIRFPFPEKAAKLLAIVPDEWLYAALSQPHPPTDKPPVLQLERWGALVKIGALGVYSKLTGRI